MEDNKIYQDGNQPNKTLEPTPVMQTTEPTPVMQTTEPTPVMQTTEPTPVMQTTEPTPVMQTVTEDMAHEPVYTMPESTASFTENVPLLTQDASTGVFSLQTQTPQTESVHSTPNAVIQQYQAAPSAQQNFQASQVQPLYSQPNVNKKKSGNFNKKIIAAVIAITLILNGGIIAAGLYFASNMLDNGKEGQRPIDNVLSSVKSNDQKDESVVSAVLEQGELTIPAIAKKAGPAVVGVISNIEQVGFFGMVQSGMVNGSGIILSEDGYIITNSHVIENASTVTITLNTGEEFPATLVGSDTRSDIAVIKIDPKDTELIAAVIGDSAQLEVGELAVAIGNPMGQEFAGSLTVGVISALNRTISIDNKTLNLIQTDAAINSGNSGGALINKYGQVIGINTAKFGAYGVEGMGFAIPIAEAMPIITDLIDSGYVKGRPIIGISGRAINAQQAESREWVAGVQIMEVHPDSGADIAGLKRGDIITKVNNEVVATVDDLNKTKDKFKPGDVLEMEVFRYETYNIETVRVKLGEDRPTNTTP